MRKLRTLLTYISSNRIWLVTLACLELFFVFLAWFAYPENFEPCGTDDICISCRLDPPAGNLNLQTQENRHRLSMFPVRAG